MPKKYIFYLVGFILLAAAGFYGYYKWSEAQEKVDLWTLVPDDAVFVVETNRHERFISQLKQTDIWVNLSRLPYFTNLQEDIHFLDSASARRLTLRDFLRQKKIVTSIHVTSKNDFDFVVYLPVSSVAEHRYIRNFIENVAKSNLFKTEEQDYQGYVLTRVQNVQNKDAFTFFTYRNNIVFSSNTGLLQQVIRKINRAKLESPVYEFDKINFLKERGVYASIFINYRHLAPFISLFLKPEIHPDVDYLVSLCRTSLLALQLDDQKFSLNGFSKPEILTGSLYQQLNPQQPQTSRLSGLVPDRTAILLLFGSQQFSNLNKSKSQAGTLPFPALTPWLDSLRQTLQQELALCYLAMPTENIPPEKVVLAFTPKPEQAQRVLQNLNAAADVRFAPERAGRYRIQEIGVPELPMQLFGQGFRGFPRCFAAQVDSFLLFAASEETLRGYVQNIRDKKTWANKDQQQNFLQQTLLQSNLSIILNTQNTWNLLNQYLPEDKKVSLLRYESLIRKFGQVSWQFSRQNEQFVTRILLQHKVKASSTDEIEEKFRLEQEIAFAAPLITGPDLLNRRLNNTNGLFMQDSAFVLHQVTTEGKIAWSDSLDSKLTSVVYPLTLESEPQPKYVFSTRNHIYCLNQAGKDVENFPFNLSDSTFIQNLTVIEREEPNNYNFLVNDTRGNVYIYDRQGNLLPGWEPKEMPAKLALAPAYLKVKGREVIVLVLENGYVYALDGNGLNYPGFPINLKGSFTSSLIAQPSASLRDSKIIVLSQAGELITFNLAGQMEKRMAFARPSRRTTFELIPENSGPSFLIARQDLGRVNLYDANQKLVMEKTYVTSAPKLIQYFYFDPANRVYVITERGPQKTYLYDINIKLIGDRPFTNNLPVHLEYNPILQQYQLYKAADNLLQELTFRTRP
ncbi:hypothetical protein AHMF7605_07485 [Adhaeribacter arboris]|uniref:DUF3352 domain-containing protein n=1 Tax=Adhaeribacter arboris TaxID=2072846 RepID=A0A2T2YCZ3_9BACT|nr:hypothetical protein [Adhaeribacter arboris]PSR53379.1 hypothetical protein AHMF7605_07485 [Adhaeribacter arboris]